MASKTTHRHFENNPFFIATSGITLLANLAHSVFAVFIFLAILELFSNSFLPYPTELSYKDVESYFHGWSLGHWLIAGGGMFIVALAAALLAALLSGVSAYTSARLARGHEVRLTIAVVTAYENVWSYLWLQTIIVVKLLLWTLLFIVPGFIMAVRYSLAGVAFYDDKKHLRGNAAVRESIKMTKNGWLTTYASKTLLNILTLGAIQLIISTAVNTVLYRQFERTGKNKPAAHRLSWITLLLPLFVFAIFGSLALTIATSLGHKVL